MKITKNVFKLTLLLTIGTTATAHAYSDPGSGLMLVQILGSTVVGALFYFHKIKKFLTFKLKTKKNDDN